MLEKNQVWLWYKDDLLLQVFIVEELVDWGGKPSCRLYGHNEKFTEVFFDDMEVLEDINMMVVDEEKAHVLRECAKYNVPVPKQLK